MPFRSRQVSRRNNGAIDNQASARWTSHEIGQIIVLTGRGVERRTDVPQCRSMETVVIDKSGGSINGNDCWQLIRTIKQRRKLSTVSDTNFAAASITVKRVCVVSVMRSIENRNRKIISGAEIDDTIFADFRENRPDTISDTSIVRSLISIS
jgi:hypothetical protein